MMRLPPRLLLVPLLAAAMAAHPVAGADAVEWSSLPGDSSLAFSAYYEGEKLPGRFEQFSVSLQTDAASGAPLRLVVEVATGSADMNDREINAEIGEAEWFATDSFPSARFESTDFEATETGYLAQGRLSLKGVERPLELPLSWSHGGDAGELTGTLRMSRLDWRIGTGEWENDASLSDRVDLRWHVRMAPSR